MASAGHARKTRQKQYVPTPSACADNARTGPKKEHWLKGNLHRIFQDGLEYNLWLTQKYGGVVKIHTLLGGQQLYVSDPLALQHIVVKEQHIFTETDMFIMGNKLMFGEGLVSTLGEQHRKQRKILNPVFSLANMRELLPVIQPIASKMRSVLLSQLPDGGGSREIDVLPWMSRGALEYISQGCLGYTFNALEPAQSYNFAEAIRSFAPTALRLIFLRPFIPFIVRNISLYWRNELVDWLPIKGLRHLRRIARVMDGASNAILFEKKAELEEGSTTDGTCTTKSEGNLGDHMKKKDIMTILLRANASSDPAERLTEAELIGQMNTVIVAGVETPALAGSRLLHALASRPTAQARLRSELRRAKLDHAASQGIPLDGSSWSDIELPYDILMSLPYLDTVVRETLRVYPPSSLLSRTARQTTTLPLQFPVLSSTGEEVTSVVVPEGTTVIISVLAANHNKAVWGDDASEWRRERWLNASGQLNAPGPARVRSLTVRLVIALKDRRIRPAVGVASSIGVQYMRRCQHLRSEFCPVLADTPGSKMTFFGGGRACMCVAHSWLECMTNPNGSGFKLSEMEIKQIIAALISNMHFSLPSAVDEHGNRKEIYWMKVAHVPFVPSYLFLDLLRQFFLKPDTESESWLGIKE
ncbi:cytochrome P450 [Lactarius akahatsu]|uniref:Cytochrome P450 n=1 Tax=Lactarius akahatsu TaxID=416441 RepID=A0AAD4QDM0_9AGAM|nr:cytochrome P450 [Lactarius akahatsu]